MVRRRLSPSEAMYHPEKRTINLFPATRKWNSHRTAYVLSITDTTSGHVISRSSIQSSTVLAPFKTLSKELAVYLLIIWCTRSPFMLPTMALSSGSLILSAQAHDGMSVKVSCLSPLITRTRTHRDVPARAYNSFHMRSLRPGSCIFSWERRSRGLFNACISRPFCSEPS